FLQDYQAQYQRTEIFINRIKDLDLLTELNAQTQLPNGQKLSMGGILGIDENKLLQLEKKQGIGAVSFRGTELDLCPPAFVIQHAKAWRAFAQKRAVAGLKLVGVSKKTIFSQV
ncbi:MAG: SapC family protein, partial [Magnetococcus sp. XQGC-1]